ncbi:MAG: hypothetical protein C0617_14860 [Desulfuromonas sp.]|uniref:monovalent cation:proton antiporter family protein n=1 Tax=Desulfuromonas sp. TaxID=892 RepID=UPI000CB242E2|nr:monovalent cation:proton antiporter family protein [Desulfuromonas sp.]PLX82388.1 MAG: hypothetical protein C0617_14860 [Desulfuromonas sp.]
MTDLSFLNDLLILFGMALANAFLFARLKQSPMVGYLATGILIGPYGLHLIEGVHEVEVMAEIGVILLLFTIGLEFSFSRILRIKGLLLRCGTVQVLLTALIVFAGARLAGLPYETAGALGMALALSSTAIVLKLLLEGGEIDTAHGRTCLAILLFQDLMVIFFLVALPLLGGQTEGISTLGLAKAAALMGGLFLFSRYGLQPLLRGIIRTRSPELFRLTVLALVLGTAWVTAAAGLSLALGAFLAGLALAESDYSHQVLSDVVPFRDTFLALFFISMGMLVDVRVLAEQWPLVLGLCALLCLIKIITGTAAALVTRYPLRAALLCGLIIFQVGEFSFVLMRQALHLGLLDEPIYQMTLAVIALSMVATPLLMPRAPAIAARIAGLFGRPAGETSPEVRERTGNLEGHVIIAGYGLSGRNIGKVLRQMHLPAVHLEMNGEAVRRASKAGEFVVYGDATSPTLLQEVGIMRARAPVLAINDPSALARAIRAARDLNPELYILARTRFVAELDYLTSLGADEVVPDELEASLQLSAFLLRRFSVPEGQTLKVLAHLRQEHYQDLRTPASPPANLSGYLSVLEGGKVEFQAVPDDSPCLHRSLAEIDLRRQTGVTVVGVIRHERTIYGPGPGLHLEPGDTLMLIGEPEDVLQARELLHGHPL